MNTYKLTFSNNHKGARQFKNLDGAQATAVTYMTNNINVTKCKIICPNGALSIVIKDGSYHYKHNGFSFVG
jgi:hypothetical protein